MNKELFIFILPISFAVFGLLLLFPGETPDTGQDSNPKEPDSHLLYEETFEGPDPFDFVWKQFPENHSFQVSNSPVFQGKKSGKFELRHGDRIVTKTGVRSEVLFPEQFHRERWYSFAVYFPSDGYPVDNDAEIITQWHQEQMGSPSTSLFVENDHLIIVVRNDPVFNGEKREKHDLGQVPKDQWQEFVFHFIHSNDGDGLLEIWRNGDKILTRSGPNIYPGILPKWKIGIYKWTWEKTKTSVNKRIVYFDNVRMGNEKATLEDLMSINSVSANNAALAKSGRAYHAFPPTGKDTIDCPGR
ncbi:hypothetical protein P872_14850 [Rhodonellum psychrophilum GCM71 = DSM 17998]|uniref:Uncharacterized protein n=2 Tax=Rhodonellum TaxID=336827 RepID=U5C7Z8_9BACT|nr:MULTISPECIES: polysaccharide lyase [Rhodonellum]ERM84322.1 hypothetical protein P872_14850 [Rhodonellum psychrophilum GCM71 = DSM 17998]MDO9554496.1 polysaccharide lyase [Rhodonellum sp.]SDZ43142.1 Polysaccharide lyase [Rhodonellum ikkaensis]